MQVIAPFSYLFGIDLVKDDFSELKTAPCETAFHNHDLVMSDEPLETNKFRILNTYTKSKDQIMNHFYSFIEGVYGWDIEFAIIASWIVKLEKGGQVDLHNHSNSMFSGCLYYDEYEKNATDDSLHFVNPIAKHSSYYLYPRRSNPYTDNFSVKPQHNLLVFFPSHIEHKTQVYMSDTPRYCLAFNMIPVPSVAKLESDRSNDNEMMYGYYPRQK